MWEEQEAKRIEAERKLQEMREVNVVLKIFGVGVVVFFWEKGFFGETVFFRGGGIFSDILYGYMVLYTPLVPPFPANIVDLYARHLLTSVSF